MEEEKTQEPNDGGANNDETNTDGANNDETNTDGEEDQKPPVPSAPEKNKSAEKNKPTQTREERRASAREVKGK